MDDRVDAPDLRCRQFGDGFKLLGYLRDIMKAKRNLKDTEHQRLVGCHSLFAPLSELLKALVRKEPFQVILRIASSLHFSSI